MISRDIHLDKSHAHWQKRPEKNWEKFQYNQPYAQGLTNVKKVIAETNFDPATLWQWGTMQAMALIEILRSAEKTFGAAGQKLVLDALKKIGHDIGAQILADTEIDPALTTDEWISFYATVINRVAYASLEAPRVGGQGDSHASAPAAADFHIDYCPHQDMYQAMDCRVQRYFVQGMIDAARDFARSKGRDDIYDVMFKTTIPAGHATCFFEIEKGDAGSAERWARYTEILEKKNLKIAAAEQANE
ncbi:MAG: hypothetical protein KF713_12250 [Turneriella sp.]|nr:hypothetical protein [Turneriella sp.]